MKKKLGVKKIERIPQFYKKETHIKTKGRGAFQHLKKGNAMEEERRKLPRIGGGKGGRG